MWDKPGELKLHKDTRTDSKSAVTAGPYQEDPAFVSSSCSCLGVPIGPQVTCFGHVGHVCPVLATGRWPHHPNKPSQPRQTRLGIHCKAGFRVRCGVTVLPCRGTNNSSIQNCYAMPCSVVSCSVQSYTHDMLYVDAVCFIQARCRTLCNQGKMGFVPYYTSSLDKARACTSVPNGRLPKKLLFCQVKGQPGLSGHPRTSFNQAAFAYCKACCIP